MQQIERFTGSLIIWCPVLAICVLVCTAVDDLIIEDAGGDGGGGAGGILGYGGPRVGRIDLFVVVVVTRDGILSFLSASNLYLSQTDTYLPMRLRGFSPRAGGMGFWRFASCCCLNALLQRRGDDRESHLLGSQACVFADIREKSLGGEHESTWLPVKYRDNRPA